MAELPMPIFDKTERGRSKYGRANDATLYIAQGPVVAMLHFQRDAAASAMRCR